MSAGEDILTQQHITIYRVENGYLLTDQDGRSWVCEENEKDELAHHEWMLWKVIEFFGFSGSRYDKERIRIVRKKGDKFER